jgi:hypothetical protein
MKNKYKSKLFGMVMLVSVLIICVGIASAITMQGGNVVGQMSDLASGASSAGTTAIATVEHGTGSTNSNAGINVDDAAGIAASDASAEATASTGGVVVSATVAWGNLKNSLGGFSYNVNVGSAKPGATVEAVSHAGVDLSASGQSAVEYGVDSQVFDSDSDVDTADSDTSDTVTTGSDTSEDIDTPTVVTDEIGNSETDATGDSDMIAMGNVGVTMEELSSTADVDQGTEIQ